VITRAPVLDRQATATLIAGFLLLAISFFANVGYGALLHIRAAALDEQIGICLHLAALAALLGDAELASRLRDRARNEEIERGKQEARRRVAVIRFQLADTSISRLQLNAALAELL
jgi:membrane protein implicated in regulation of membrane protease activity